MTTWLTTVGWTLIHFVWQACAIALPVALLLKLTARRSANVRYAIACAGLASMVLAPVATQRLLMRSTGDDPFTPVTTAVGETQPAISRSAVSDRSVAASPSSAVSTATAGRSLPDLDRLAPMVTIVWLVGVGVLLARMAGGWWRVRRLHRRALAQDASHWQAACRRIAVRLGLPAAAHVVESALVEVPTVIGFLRPAILLPISALSTLTPNQIEAILAHELAHIRRHDYIVNVLQTLAETLLFYHPMVWWLSNRIRVEREHCCDDVAVAVCGDPVGYAEALAALEDARTHDIAMAVAATGGSLLQRVRRVLGVSDPSGAYIPRSSTWAATVALTAFFTAGAGSVQQLPSLRGTTADAAESAHIAALPAEQPSAATGALATDTQPRVVPRPPEPPEPPDLDIPEPPQAPEPPEIPEPPEPPDFISRFGELLAPPAPPTPLAIPAPPAPPAPPAQPAPPAPPAPPAQPAPPARPATPAVPAPPAAPAAPAPPAPRAFALQGTHEWRWSWSDDDVRLDVTLNGSIAFKDDLSDVESLADGAVLKIRNWSGLIPHTFELRGENGRVVRAYYVAGVSRPWDAETQRRFAEELPRLVRRTGLGAEQRVKSIYARRGLNGVLDEIGLLEGDYARRLYFVALIDQAKPDAAAATAMMRRMDRMQSDYERGQVLQSIAAHAVLDQGAAAEYARAAAPMKSDYERRRALVALLGSRPLPQGTAALAARSAADMKSDYERSEVLRTALSREPMTDADALFTAFGRMTSAYEQRRVLTALVERPSLSVELKRGLLAAAGNIKSDYERATVLLEFAARQEVDASVRQPFFGAVNGMSSDYEKRRVLTAVASKAPADADVQRAAFDSVTTMHSDYDRAEALLAFLRSGALSPSSRQAFVAAAERISSSHDQNRVLGALVRADRR